MERESLEIVQNEIVNMINRIDNANVPIYDKVELLINLTHFLNPDEYKNNIKVLQKKK